MSVANARSSGKRAQDWRTPAVGLGLVRRSTLDAFDRVVNALRILGHRVSQRSSGWCRAKCPAHDDHSPSLTFRYTRGRVLIKCWSGCPVERVLAVMGLTLRDLYDVPYVEAPARVVVATFEHYVDLDGRSLTGTVRKVRFGPRRVFQWQHHAGDRWRAGLEGIAVGLFNLDAVRGSPVALWVEGEGVAQTATAHGLAAVCSPRGANADAGFIGRLIGTLERAGVEEVIVIPDNDQPGRQHAAVVLATADECPMRAKLVTLPGVGLGGDLVDYFALGHSADEVRRLIAEAPRWTAESESTRRRAHHAAWKRQWRARRQARAVPIRAVSGGK